MTILRVTPAELDTLSARFSREAQSVTTVMSSIDSVVRSTQWDGVASGKFQQEWEAYKRHLQRLNEALNETSAAVKKQAANYRAADGQL